MFKKIKNSYFKSLRGEENFWVVLLRWGILLFLTSITMGFLTAFITEFLINAINNDFLNTLCFLIRGIVGGLGIVLVFIYPLMLIFSLIRCATNYSFYYVLLAIIVSSVLGVIILLLHVAILLGSVSFIQSSKISLIASSVTLIASIYILIKTTIVSLTKNQK